MSSEFAADFKSMLRYEFRYYLLSGRRSRASYLKNISKFIVVIIAAISAYIYFQSDIALAALGFISLCALWGVPAISAQRCRDFDWSGWYGLIILIPGVNVLFLGFLLFNPGTAGPNKYGSKPINEDYI